MMNKMDFVTFSECGNRWENQDCYRVLEQQERSLFLICDGMGKHYHGSLSSKTVCDAIENFWKQNEAYADCTEKVQEACRIASVALDKCADELGRAEMGTTMVMASVEGTKVTIAHCGDSRCYLLRPEEDLIFQTKDHIKLSFGWEVLVNSFFSYRSDKLVPEIHQFELKEGDRLFLCSDGVYKSVKTETLITCLLENKTIEWVADKLKFLCEKNKDDNYTGIILNIGGKHTKP